jgi:hypothetical protein
VVELAKKVQAGKSGDKIPDTWGFAIQQYDRPYLTLPLIVSSGAGDLSPDGTQELTVIQVALTKHMTELVTCWGRLLAGSMLATLPIVILLFLLQRYYV